jgi:hypothetical protein
MTILHPLRTWIQRRWRWLAGGLVIVVLLGAGLVADLAAQGLVWQTLWHLTGEESPVGQVRGFTEWLGNFTRRLPDTQPDTVPELANVNPYGINTFLQHEVELSKREQQMQLIADAGFHWIRQEFAWEDIEIHAQGDFEDRRNDPVRNAWDKYDHIVDLAEAYGIEIQARLSNPPAWSRAAGNDNGTLAPPDDFDDFVRYAVTVAERYQGRIHTYQVWNEPNIYPEWGENPVDAAAYTDLLCRTYDALKAVDPDIVVLSGALAPTTAIDGRNIADLIFLQQMYDAGAGDCFDVLTVNGYGLWSGPTDRRMRPMVINYGRNQWIRDIMVQNGDADKPIWISEMNWNPVPEPDVEPNISGRYNYGQVTPEQQARWVPLAYDRAANEWPWVGVINYWYFKPAADYERNQSWYYFRMLEPDFTPLPVYDAMREYIAAHPFEG